MLQVEGGPPKKSRTEVVINNDLERVKFPRDDPLVIMQVIGNSSVKQVMVDGGASLDILFHEAFLKMGYNDSQMTHFDKTKVERIIHLTMNMGQEPCEVTQMLNFFVIKVVTS